MTTDQFSCRSFLAACTNRLCLLPRKGNTKGEKAPVALLSACSSFHKQSKLNGRRDWQMSKTVASCQVDLRKQIPRGDMCNTSPALVFGKTAHKILQKLYSSIYKIFKLTTKTSKVKASVNDGRLQCVVQNSENPGQGSTKVNSLWQACQDATTQRNTE